MKKLIFIILIALFSSSRPATAAPPGDELSGRISISGAFALYPLTVKWAEEFKKIHPNVTIDVSAGGAGKGITDVLSGMTDIGLVSRDIYQEELAKGAFPIPVTKDAVVATISASNPFIRHILTRGLTRADFSGIFITGNVRQWSQLDRAAGRSPIHVYTRSDACGAAETWAKYLGNRQEDLLGTAVFGDPGLAQAVLKDPLGIGFNNIVYVFDSRTRKQTNGVRIVPIDLNGNGRIDPEENFYDSRDRLVDAIGSGKYPSPPARDLYFVFKGKPEKKVVKQFVRWVLTDGQRYVQEAGYLTLPSGVLNDALNNLRRQN